MPDLSPEGRDGTVNKIRRDSCSHGASAGERVINQKNHTIVL